MKAAPAGTISDGSGTSNYANSAECEWIIAPTGASFLAISFSEFNTASFTDFVRVIQCTTVDCDNVLELGTLSGSYSTAQLFSVAGSFIKVTFITDESISGPGFVASWNSVCMYIMRISVCNLSYVC